MNERSRAEAALRASLSGLSENTGSRGPPPPPIKFEWKNSLELCDILVHDNREKHLGPDNFILLYNSLSKPIIATVDYNPILRKFQDRDAITDPSNVKMILEMDEKRCERIGETMLIFPDQVNMAQISTNMQAFVSIQVVHKDKLIPLYSSKKLFFLQALCVGLRPVDESQWVHTLPFVFISLIVCCLRTHCLSFILLWAPRRKLNCCNVQRPNLFKRRLQRYPTTHYKLTIILKIRDRPNVHIISVKNKSSGDPQKHTMQHIAHPTDCHELKNFTYSFVSPRLLSASYTDNPKNPSQTDMSTNDTIVSR